MLTCRSFVHNLDIHRNGRASCHKARPGDQLNTGFLRSFLGFSPIKTLLGRTKIRTCERVSAVSRYEQFGISSESIEQELWPVD